MKGLRFTRVIIGYEVVNSRRPGGRPLLLQNGSHFIEETTYERCDETNFRQDHR